MAPYFKSCLSVFSVLKINPLQYCLCLSNSWGKKPFCLTVGCFCFVLFFFPPLNPTILDVCVSYCICSVSGAVPVIRTFSAGNIQ